MNCTKIRDNLDEYVIGSLEPDTQRECDMHIAVCMECRTAVEKTRKLATDSLDIPGDVRDIEQRMQDVRHGLDAELAAIRRQSRLTLVLKHMSKAAVFILGTLLFGVIFNQLHFHEHAGAGFTPAWRHAGISRNTDRENSYPMICGELVLAFEGVGADRMLFAVDRETGEGRWQTNFAVRECTYSEELDTLFAWCPEADGSGQLKALMCDTGEVSRSFPSTATVAPLVQNSLMTRNGRVCWITDNRLHVLDGSTGRIEIDSRLGDDSTLAVTAFDDRRIYVASNDYVRALDWQTGELCWKSDYQEGSRLPWRPLLRVHNGKLVVARRMQGGHGGVYCHDSETGELRWERQDAHPVHSLTVAGNIYLRSDRAYALAATDGRQLWSTDLSGCSPLRADEDSGLVYALAGRRNPSIMAIDGYTGEQVWARTAAASCNGLVVVDKKGYLSAHDGAIYAVKL